jgi:hypothetical protein
MRVVVVFKRDDCSSTQRWVSPKRHMDDIYACSKDELGVALRAIDIAVPPRTEGRTTEDCERWSICRLLSTLINGSVLSFPLRVTKREKPDFQVCLGQKAWGIEVTEAIPTDDAKANALAEKENPNALIDISLFKFGEAKSLDEIRQIINQAKLTGDGWAGDAAERELAEAIRCIVESKTKKLRAPTFDKYPQNILVIYDNMPLPHLDHDTIAVHCADQLEDYWSEQLVFDVIYVESRDTIFQITSNGARKLKINDILDDA